MIIENVEKFIIDNFGAGCEVITVDNMLLYVGFVGIYERREGIVQIRLRRGMETPRGYEFHTPVKVRITPLYDDRHVLLLGSVFRCDKDFWFIKPEKIEQYNENRNTFRQYVNLEGFIRGEEEAVKEMCQLQDISQTGGCFLCSHRYETGTKTELTGIQIRENGQIYNFHCQIVRAQKMEKRDFPDKKEISKFEWKYGCRFIGMDKKMQNMLLRDILFLQAKSLN